MEWLLDSPEVVYHDRSPAKSGKRVSWPRWVSEELRQSCFEAGIEKPWRHQASFADRAFRGEHVALTTSTGSGKSLAYLLPILTATAEDRIGWEVKQPRLGKRNHTALYISPTKALAHDQLRAAKQLAGAQWSAVALDGDSTSQDREYARDFARVLFTNPDMLHYSVLPHHQQWSRIFAGLRYVVVDEAHRYQGLFGAHISQVLRRLRRIAHHYGATPVFMLTSATMKSAESFGSELIGDKITSVDDDAAPRSGRLFVFWKPEISLTIDTANLLGKLVECGSKALAFVSSRLGAELVARRAQELCGKKIASYRAGYTPIERRALEQALQEGNIRGLATTNALELGIDIAGMDAVLVSGYPGRISSLWQQAGRAGRGGNEALVVFLAKDDPLDAFFFDHPEAILQAPVEQGIIFPDNPHVLGPHLAAAAQEIPLSQADEQWFGRKTIALAEVLAKQGLLRNRVGRYYWTKPQRAVDFVSLRSSTSKPIDIVEADTGRVLGIVEESRVDSVAHQGAVYLHQGESFVVKDLDMEQRIVLVTTAEPGYYTQVQTNRSIDILREVESVALGITTVYRGEVRLNSQVVGYLRRDQSSHEVWDQVSLEMPRRRFETQAVWWTIPDLLIQQLGWRSYEVGAAAHAVEHTAIGLLPAFVTCDRWDIGGLSTVQHQDTGLATIFVHDGHPGGAGFSFRGYVVIRQWLGATLLRLKQCRCKSGCPSCVVSPKCGTANQSLNKEKAIFLLQMLLGDSAS